MTGRRALVLLAVIGLGLSSAEARAGAMGYGGRATGGTGKPIFAVTTLVDSPSDGQCGKHCSLRDALVACKAAGGGNIHFRGLSGDIDLATGGGNFIWDCANSTIDGSTAAGQGVQILGGPPIASSNQFILDADNVIIRNMRFRCSHYTGNRLAPGCVGGNRDIFAIQGGRDIWVDHCSFQWGTDSLGDIGDGPRAASDITYSNNLFAESLGVGAVLIGSGATRISFYRNAFISNGGRLPAIQPTSVAFGVDTVAVELVENYWYNYIMAVQYWAGTPALVVESSVVGNVWETGPIGDVDERVPLLYRNLESPGNRGRVLLFQSGNGLLDGGLKWSKRGASGRACDPMAAETTFWIACTWPATPLSACHDQREAPCAATAATPFAMPLTAGHDRSTARHVDLNLARKDTDEMMDVVDARSLKEAVLSSAGASLLCRDALDAKVIADAQSSGVAGPQVPLKVPTTTLPDLTVLCP